MRLCAHDQGSVRHGLQHRIEAHGDAAGADRRRQPLPPQRLRRDPRRCHGDRRHQCGDFGEHRGRRQRRLLVREAGAVQEEGLRDAGPVM